MPQQLKPVAPSVKDVKKQLRQAIKSVKVEQAKQSGAQIAHAAKLTAKISALNASLAGAAGNIKAQERLLKRHQELVREHARRNSELNGHVEGYKIELKQLKKTLADMNDLGD